MNLKQIVILIVAVVVLVSLVTAVKVLVPVTPPTPQDKFQSLSPKPVVLTFPETLWPAPAKQGSTERLASEEPLAFVQEAHQRGVHDFWFQNDNDVSIQLGLLQKNCTCANVSVALALTGWRENGGQLAAAAMVLGHAGPLGAAELAATAGAQNRPQPGPNVDWKHLAPADNRPLQAADCFTIPPWAGGWVRLGWNASESEPKRLSADLAMVASSTSTIRLEASVSFVAPIKVWPTTKELSVAQFTAGDSPRQARFLCWSPTRRHFTLKPYLHDESTERSNRFITCEQLAPLNHEECQQLENERKTRVLSGYAVILTVHQRLANDDQMDMGPFRATAFLKSDAMDGSLELVVTGTVVGDVNVLTDGESRDRIRLCPFPSRFGVEKVTLEADLGEIGRAHV